MTNELSWPARPGLYLAAGPRLLPSWFLSALSPALREGRRLFWIDACNSFDAHGASYAARMRGLSPREMLSRISLARPFNLYQLETVVRRKLPAVWRGEPVVLADPLPMIMDEEVPQADARRIFLSLLSGIRELPAVWLMFCVERAVPAPRKAWLSELYRQASGCAALTERAGSWRLQKI